jgi:hypothetical protein
MINSSASIPQLIANANESLEATKDTLMGICNTLASLNKQWGDLGTRLTLTEGDPGWKSLPGLLDWRWNQSQFAHTDLGPARVVLDKESGFISVDNLGTVLMWTNEARFMLAQEPPQSLRHMRGQLDELTNLYYTNDQWKFLQEIDQTLVSLETSRKEAIASLDTVVSTIGCICET